MTTLRVRTWPADVDGPLVDHLVDDGGLAWLHDDDGLVGFGSAVIIEPGSGSARFATGSEEFAALRDGAIVDDPVRLPGSGLVAFATFTFDDRSHGSVLIVPEIVVGRHGGRGFVTWIGNGSVPSSPPPLRPSPVSIEPVDRPRYAGSSMPDVNWLEAVAQALDRIDSGTIEKVVLARDHGVWAKVPFSPRRLAGRLRQRFSGCYTFVVDGFVGATPELLVRRSGSEVTSRVLAGTARRGQDPVEDDQIAAALSDSDKDRREHELAVRTVRAGLEPVCHELTSEPQPHVLRLDNVMHLGTWFSGALTPDPGPSALELVAALHPTAAVGGVPTDRAVELIRELEGMDRGRYAGPVGWVDGRGDGEFGVALRCAQLSGARARLFAGAGIVRGSLPEDELEETRVKLLAMQSAFSP